MTASVPQPLRRVSTSPEQAAEAPLVGPFTAAVDVGGSGIKAMLLDGQGRPAGPRHRVPTPQPATVEACLPIIARLVQEVGQVERVGVGFPGVVEHGLIRSAANLHESWIGTDLVNALQPLVGLPVRACNDADVQGLAVVEGNGVELVVTLGTGVGSGLYLDGRLVPNLELGHHPFRKGETYEQQLGDAALEKAGKKKWNKRVLRAIEEIEHLFSFQRLFLGGGNAKRIQLDLPERVRLVDNLAGLIGVFCLWEPSAVGKLEPCVLPDDEPEPEPAEVGEAGPLGGSQPQA